MYVLTKAKPESSLKPYGDSGRSASVSSSILNGPLVLNRLELLSSEKVYAFVTSESAVSVPKLFEKLIVFLLACILLR